MTGVAKRLWDAIVRLLRAEAEEEKVDKVARHLAKVLVWELEGKASLYPPVKDRFVKLQARMKKIGKPIYLVEGFRSGKRQNELYDKGRVSPGNIVTHAMGLESYHQYCTAFDVAFVGYNWNPPEWEWWIILGDEGKKLGLTWGGTFQDWGHFEFYPSGNRWETLKKYFEKF